ENQHFLTSLHLADGDHHAQRRAVGDRQAGGSFVRDASRQPNDVVLRHCAVLGEPSGSNLSDQATATDAVNRVDHPPPSNRPVLCTGSKRRNFTGKIDTHDARHRNPNSGHAAARKDVVIVQGRSSHAHENFAGAGLGIGELSFIADRAWTAVFVDHRCLHGMFLSWVCAVADQRSRASLPSSLRSTLLVVESGSSAMKTTPRGCW